MLLQTTTRDRGKSRYLPSRGSSESTAKSTMSEASTEILKHYHLAELDEIIAKLSSSPGKKSFLVFKNHKYVNILTENIAYFYVRYDTTIIVTFDKQEYFVNHSLEQIQQLVSTKQFYRINRQYLINFDAVKEAEHYFARKLLVNLALPAKEKLIVSKEKATDFLHWLDNR